ncbi:MAG TPA: DUF433 domain-containing protein [Verrucomicrobiae bacterium]
MTIRLPKGVKRSVERLAARFGHKPAQLGARYIEESVRRREYPQVDLRETAAGRVAYVGGTRFAVHWVVGMVPHKMSPEDFAKEYELPVDRVRAALAYAQAYAAEIKNDREHAEANRKWIEQQDAAARPLQHSNGNGKGKGKAAR